MADKLGKTGRKTCVAAVAAVIGLILYIITSTTGYLASSAMNPLPVILTVISVVILAALTVAKNLSSLLSDLMIAVAAVLLMVSFAFFVLGRVTLAADIYFIPVNYPQSEVTALNQSIAGIVFYLISILTMIAIGFTAREEV